MTTLLAFAITRFISIVIAGISRALGIESLARTFGYGATLTDAY
jgi:hypothetical protein